MKKVATAILTASDQIIGILAGLVRIVVETVITTAVTTIIGSAGRIIDGLIELCDVLLVKAPTLVEKLILVLAEVLAQFERRCGPLIAQVVSTVATIIEQVAQAILDNADKIINAIDKVITAVSTLIVKSIAKIFGFDKFKGAVNTLVKIVKPVSAALLAMFAYAKIKKNAQVIITVLNTLKNRLKLFKAGLSSGGFANGWKEFLGINKLNEAWERVTLAHERGMAKTGTIFKNGAATILKAAGIGTAVGAVLGSVVKAFIDAKTDSMNVVDTWAAELSSKYADTEKKVYTAMKETSEKTKQYRDEMYGVDVKYDPNKQKLNKLFDMVDASTGRIKEGKEDEVTSLVEEINSELGTRLILENNILSIMDEQGKKRKADLDNLLKINTAEELKAKVEASKTREEEITKKGGELDQRREELDEARANQSELAFEKQAYIKEYGELLKEYEAIEEIRKENDPERKKEYESRLRDYRDALEEFEKAYDVDFSEYDIGSTENDERFHKRLEKYNGDLLDLASTTKSAQRNLNMLVRWLDNLANARGALASGDDKLMRESNLTLSGYYDPTASLATAEADADKYLEHLKDAIDRPKEWAKSRIESEYEAMKMYYEGLGKSEKDKADLEALWNKYLESYEKSAGELTTDYGNKSTAVGALANKGKSLLTDALKDGTSSFDFSKTLEKNNITGELKDSLMDQFSKASTEAANSSKTKTAMNGAMGALGAIGGTSYAESFVGRLSDALLGEKTSSIFTSIFEGIQEDVGDGFFDLLQNSIFPAIAGLTGNSSMFGSLFPVNFGGIQNGSGLSGTANAPAL
jgi:hypothetical protein